MAENEGIQINLNEEETEENFCGYCSQCGSEIEREFIFCPQCGVNIERRHLSRTVPSGNHSLSEREIIESYFFSGFEYESILQFLSKFHGIKMSMSTLKRRLKMFGLQRKNQEVNMNEVTEIMRRELSQSGCLFGYRAMWHTLRIKYSILVPRNLVQIRLKELDPQGSQDRRRHRLKRRVYNVPGPNYCWHVDGHDKIKPYGFPLHGAIDGYSRRLLWLKVARTNNDPAVTAKYFYDCIEELEGCPRLLRTDCGTENGVMATMQCLLRAEGEDELAGEKSHRYGPSTGNQQIESFWSQLRKGCTTWWMNFFKDMCDRGILNLGNVIHMEALWFCFAHLLQQDLDFFTLYWNTHYIRPSRHETIAGRPDELFFNPESRGATSHLQPIDEVLMEELKNRCKEADEATDHQLYFRFVLEHENLSEPKNCQEAVHLFQHLTSVAE